MTWSLNLQIYAEPTARSPNQRPSPLRARGFDYRDWLAWAKRQDNRSRVRNMPTWSRPVEGYSACRRLSYAMTYPPDQGLCNKYSTYDEPTRSRSVEGYSACHRLSYVPMYASDQGPDDGYSTCHRCPIRMRRTLFDYRTLRNGRIDEPRLGIG